MAPLSSSPRMRCPGMITWSPGGHNLRRVPVAGAGGCGRPYRGSRPLSRRAAVPWPAVAVEGPPGHHEAMLESIRAFFDQRMNVTSNGNGAEAPSAPSPRDVAAADRKLHIAACALLLELAHADEEFSASERLHIEAVLRRHFDLDEETAQELMALAEQEQAESIDLFQFTSLIRENYDLGQKTLLAEIMWGLILADGEIAKREAYMLRKIANLLDLEPGYLSAARKRAAEE